MLINCYQCSEKTNNPKFCSKSCAAKYNNKIPKRKKKLYFCCKCNREVKYRRKYCINCSVKTLYNWQKITYREITKKRKYQKKLGY